MNNPTELAEGAPRFTSRSSGNYQLVNERSRRRFDAVWNDLDDLTPADAVRLAQRLLVAVNDQGIDYGDFESAQATEKYVRQAIRALRGLPLSP